jgi:hypothetical protein
MANREFYVQPADYGSGWREAAQMIGDYRQKQDQQAYQEAAKKAATEAMQSGDPRKIREAVIQFPEIAKTMTDMFGFTNDQTKQVAKDTYRKALSDPQNAAQYLQEGISQVSQFGGRPTTMAADFQMFQQNPEAALKNMRVGYAGIASEEEYGAMFGEDEGMGGPTPAAIRAFEAYAKAAKLEPGTPEYIMAAQIELGLQPRAGISAQERIAGDPSLSTQVAASEGEIEATKDAAKQAIKKSGEAYDRLATVKSTIPKYDEAIRLVKEEGASSGPIASRFPSFQSSTLELEAVQRELGLDVVSSVTFGALSEAELAIAMQTGLPTNLEGPALIDWLERKKASQQKLAEYVSEAAQFLGTPRNTVAMWMNKNQAASQSKGEEDAAVNWSDL